MRVRFGQSRSSHNDGLGERDVMAQVVPGVGARYCDMISVVIPGTAPLNRSVTHEVPFLS